MPLYGPMVSFIKSAAGESVGEGRDGEGRVGVHSAFAGNGVTLGEMIHFLEEVQIREFFELELPVSEDSLR